MNKYSTFIKLGITDTIPVFVKLKGRCKSPSVLSSNIGLMILEPLLSDESDSLISHLGLTTTKKLFAARLSFCQKGYVYFFDSEIFKSLQQLFSSRKEGKL